MLVLPSKLQYRCLLGMYFCVRSAYVEFILLLIELMRCIRFSDK